MLTYITSLMPIEILLKVLLYKFLTYSYCITLVSEKILEFPINNSFVYISPKRKESIEYQLLNVSEMGCSDYVVCVQDPKSFMVAFDKVVHMGYVRRSDRKIIFIPYEEGYDTKMKLLDILNINETKFVPNILLILPGDKSENCDLYDLVTHNYGGPDIESNQPYLMDKWNSCSLEFEKNVNLFPNNMSNLKGKTINVASFTYKPYALLDLDKSITPLGRDGTEVRLVDEFCRWINCTIELIEDDVNAWGKIYSNRSGIGVLGNVAMDRADIGIDGIFPWYDAYGYLDFSSVDIRTAVTCMVPSPRLLDAWKMPLRPFTWFMWIVLFFTFIYESITLMTAQGFISDKVFLSTFGMMLSQSLPNVGTTWRIRSVTGWVLITGLIIDNAYGSGLASVYTVPEYEKTIDTAQDIVDGNIEWGASNEAWIYSLTSSTEPLVKQLLRQFRVFPPEVLTRKSLNRSIALSIERLSSGNFAMEDYITKEAVLDLTVMQDDLYYQYCLIILRKSSPFTNKMNQLIGRLHESGLLFAWETQVVMKYFNHELQVKVKLSRTKKTAYNIESLGLRHVSGIFILYLIGMTASVLLFSAEIMMKRRLHDMGD